MPKKTKLEASAVMIIELNGTKVQPSVAMFSRSIDHPDKVEYTSGPSKGTIKKVTQYANDVKFADLISDGYTDKGKVKVETLKYKGNSLRWLQGGLSPAEKTIINTLRAQETLDTIARKALDLNKRLVNAAKNPGLNLIAEDVEKALNFVTNNIDMGTVALSNKAHNVTEAKESEVKTAFSLF